MLFPDYNKGHVPLSYDSGRKGYPPENCHIPSKMMIGEDEISFQNRTCSGDICSFLGGLIQFPGFVGKLSLAQLDESHKHG